MMVRRCSIDAIFSLATYSAGDLVFFHRLPKSAPDDFERAVVSASLLDSNIYHVALVVGDSQAVKSGQCQSDELSIVHVTNSHGVAVQSLPDALKDLEPDVVELCSLNVDPMWKCAAVQWALGELGAEYNDLFAPDCINSRRNRSFYCCQLVSESYKHGNPSQPGVSPFLPHSMNFADAEGQLIPYWIDYYRRLCPWDPVPPQGRPGTHPSILQTSPGVAAIASRLFTRKFKHTIVSRDELTTIQDARAAEEDKMNKFHIPKDLLKSLHYINGANVSLQTAPKFTVYEPRNGAVLTECHAATLDEVDKAIDVARTAQREWGVRPWAERRRILQRAADLIRKEYDSIANWEVRDNGKSITEARIDILSCADTFEYYGGFELSGDHLPYADAQHRFAYTRREPLGVVGAIGAWNYPFQTATWKIAPAIACGNAIVYKPSPLAPVSPVILAHLLKIAGVPDGIVNVVQGGAETGQALCALPAVRKVSFTGSIATGKAIAAAAAAHSLKPVTLELGGKSACIIFPDVDLQSAVIGALMANFFTQGQVCTNASKVLVHRSIIEKFTAELLLKTENLMIGDPLNESTHIGAYISADHLQKVKDYIDGAVKQGAKKLYGGERVSVEAMEGGYYMSPCILTDITPNMTVYKEEIFGAVLLIIPFDSDEEALKIANDTEAGLAAGVFTNDLNRAHQFAARLEAGTVYVNTYNDISQYVPFGGYKQSGYGRENGRAAIEYYSQVKAVFVNASGGLDNPFA